jgi:serine/threonine protein kinase/Flp pilus assembly protein TadD
MTNPDTTSPCPPANMLEQWLGHQLPEDAAQHIAEHVAVCPRCSARRDRVLKEHRLLHSRLADLDPETAPIVTPQGSMLTIHGPDPQASTHLTLPTIDGYEIRGILGKGGMGIVYEAVQLALNRRVAVKVLPAIVGSANRDLVARFKREAAAASKLHHSSIIPIYDFGECRDGYYYAMELLDGDALNVIIERIAAGTSTYQSPTEIAALVGVGESASAPKSSGPVTKSNSSRSTSSSRGKLYYRQIATWIADAADALHYAHLRGLIHRDVKPANIVLCRTGRIVVVDFGLVKEAAEESVTMTGSILGTYRYMSPEQVGAKRITVDARTDVYSLGATLYELLTLQPAFPAREQSELLGQIIWKEPTPPRRTAPSVPVDMQTICLKAMEKSPNQRYASAQDMAEDLRRFIGDLPISARPISLVGRIGKHVRRRPGVTALVALIGLLVPAVAVTYSLFRGEALEKQQASQALQAQAEEQLSEKRQLAVEAWLRGNSAKAEKVFKELIREYPNDYPSLVNYANFLKDCWLAEGAPGLLEHSLAYAEEAIRIAPAEAVEAWNTKLIVLRNMGRYADALNACDQAKRLQPEYYPIWANEGTIHALRGDLPAATKALRQACALTRKERGPLPWRNLAAVEFALGESGAWETLETAFALSSEPWADLFALRAAMCLEAGEHFDASRALQDATIAHGICGAPCENPHIGRILASAQLANEIHVDTTMLVKFLADVEGLRRADLHAVIAQALTAQGQNVKAAQHARLASACANEHPSNQMFAAVLIKRGLWITRRTAVQAVLANEE